MKAKHIGEAEFHYNFFSACEDHIDHAREKHPQFLPSGKITIFSPTGLDLIVRGYKKNKPETVTLDRVLLEEVYDFIAAMQEGDKKAALHEACDAVAVLYRALAGDLDE